MTTTTAITTTMTNATQPLSLAKLIPSPANVRRIGSTAGIEALAASIAAHGLLQSLVVRPGLDGTGQKTDRFEVVAGGRRLAALKLLVKQKRLAKTAPIPCRVLDRAEGMEASLAENVVRQDMHPADQFSAFQALHVAGGGIEDIAARFGVSAQLVRQRLRLAGVSPSLIEAYRDGKLTLDHLVAFAVTEDQGAQERVFEQLQKWQRHPETIRRLLTDALTATTDRTVRFVGLDAYREAGGTVQHDLFSANDSGWIVDTDLLERLAGERMAQEVAAVRAEGWRWVEVGQAAQSAAWDCRRVWPEAVALSEADAARQTALAERHDALLEAYNSTDEDMPEDVAAEVTRIEAELAVLEARMEVWQPETLAIAGAVLTVTMEGGVRIERGFVREEDEPRPVTNGGGDGAEVGGTASADKAPALSATLLGELEAHRTMGLQAVLARQPGLALRVLLQSLVVDAFYYRYGHRYGDAVAMVQALSPSLAACPGFADSPARQALTAEEDAWRSLLPQEPGDLWGWLEAQDQETLLALLAVCVARTAQTGCQTWTTPEGGDCLAARVAAAAGLDMRHYWTPTKDSYLGRVSKALILEAVGEAKGPDLANRLAGAKKAVMVAEAEQLLAGTGWLPPMLTVPGTTYPVDSGLAASLPALAMAAE